MPFSNVIYIERSDFRLKDSKDYFGLAPGKSALLRCSLLTKFYFPLLCCRRGLRGHNLYFHGCRYACPIKCVDAKDVILAEDEETVLEIRVEYDPEKKTKPKVYNLSLVLELKMCFGACKIMLWCFLVIF